MNERAQKAIYEVIESGCLGSSKRQTRLLSYLLTEQDKGGSPNTKAYNIALDVLDRPDGFDPSIDSIVRVEMHRLRKNLERFNMGSNALTVTIPRASYEVVIGSKTSSVKFVWLKPYIQTIPPSLAAILLIVVGSDIDDSKPTTSHASKNVCSTSLPNVGVLNSADSSELYGYVGTTIRDSLDQYSSIQLVNNIQDCSNSGTPSVSIKFTTLQDNHSFHIAMTTYSNNQTEIIGFSDVSGELTPRHGKDEIYFSVLKAVNNLAKPYGTIPKFATVSTWASELKFDNYRCLMSMYDPHTINTKTGSIKAPKCNENYISAESVFPYSADGLP